MVTYYLRNIKLHTLWTLSTFKGLGDKTSYFTTQCTFSLRHYKKAKNELQNKQHFLAFFNTKLTKILQFSLARYYDLRITGLPIRGSRINCEKRLLDSSFLSARPSIRPQGTTRFPLDGFSWNIFQYFFENLSRKFEFHSNLRRIMGILHEDQYACLITSRSLIWRLRNVLDKCPRENQNKHFKLSNFFADVVPFMTFYG